MSERRQADIDNSCSLAEVIYWNRLTDSERLSFYDMAATRVGAIQRAFREAPSE